MKKASVLLACAMGILILVLISGYPQKLWGRNETASSSSQNVSYHFTAKESSSQENSEVDVMADENNSSSAYELYTVKEYNGHIGVFRNEEAEPFEEIQVNIDLFPETDQVLLKQGIQAHTPEELNGIIEDYEG